MKKIFLKSAFLSAVFWFSSCTKNSKKESLDESLNENYTQKVEFGINISSSKTYRSSSNIPQAIAVLVSISDANGQEIVKDKQLTLRTFGTNQITEPIDLIVGDYKLTTFHVFR